jgi:uncharacterized membrane protein (DUF4010 family)
VTVAGAVIPAAFAAWHYRAGLAQTHREPRQLAVDNPFSLTAAARFGALFAVVLLVVKLAQRYAPEQGIYVVAALAGSVDVDAITLSMADAAGGTDGFARATAAIVIAAVANTVVKCGAVLALGAGPVRTQVGVATAALLAASLLAPALT